MREEIEVYCAPVIPPAIQAAESCRPTGILYHLNRWSITRTQISRFEPRGLAYIRRQMRSAANRKFNETQSRTIVKSSDCVALATIPAGSCAGFVEDMLIRAVVDGGYNEKRRRLRRLSDRLYARRKNRSQ
jgi:hypothetical protein